MNIAPTFPEAGLLQTSALQREHVDVHAEETRLRYEAQKLREYIDKYAGYLFPCGDLEDEVTNLLEAADQAAERVAEFGRKLAKEVA